MQTKIKLKTIHLVLALLSFILLSQPSLSKTNQIVVENFEEFSQLSVIDPDFQSKILKSAR